MNKNLGIIIGLFFAFHTCIAQTGIMSTSIDLFEHMPTSPNSASLGKYSNYSVSMSTGIPSIEIPIYTIKSGNINIPIKLKYHAGGILVNETASWVGLGWSLDAGGVINKRVNGQDDFTPSVNNGQGSTYSNPDYSNYSNYFTNISDAIESPNLGTYMTNNAISWQHFMGRICQGRIDGEADDYNFSTSEGGGKFFYNQKANGFQFDKINGWKVIGTPDLSPWSTNHGIGSWELLSNNGVKYNFGNDEKVPVPGDVNIPIGGYMVNSWYITNVTDVPNNKFVSYNYDEIFHKSYGGTTVGKDFTSSYYVNSNQTNNERNGFEVSVSRIWFEGGSVVFVKDVNPRLDGVGIKALKEIQVRNIYDKIIKRFKLNYFYADAESGPNYNQIGIYKQLFLQSVQEEFITPNGATINTPPYLFNYDLTNKIPARFSYGQDYWGYYNGKVNNISLLPKRDFIYHGLTNFLNIAGDREVDPAYTKAGIIKEIVYPTGSKTSFEFENNSIPPNTIIGGLRIKKIKSFDNMSNKNLVSEYIYNEGDVTFTPKHSYIYLKESMGGGFGSATTEDFLRVESNPIFPLFSSQGSPVIYTYVTEKQTSSNTEELISEHFFQNSGTIPNWENPVNPLPNPKVTFYDNINGLEYQSKIYKKLNDGSRSLIQQNNINNEYLNNANNYFWNVQVGWAIPGSNDFLGHNPSFDPYQGGPTQPLLYGVNVSAYKKIQDQAVAKEQIKTTISEGQSLTEMITNDYDITNGNQYEVKSINSLGDEIVKKIKYTSDFSNNTGVWGIENNNMLLNNMITSPIEITTFIKKKNSLDYKLTSAVLFQYENLQLKKVYKIITNSPILNFVPCYNDATGFHFDSHYFLFQEVLLRDGNYNPISVNDNKIIQSYIWDYNGTINTAFATNSSIDNIAYSSFEAESKGNFIFNGIPITALSAPTGNMVYPLTNSIITKVINPSKTYLISLWATSNAVFVNGTAPIRTGRVFGSFTFYEYQIANASNVAITGSGSIDELRLYPNDAQMKTFTYEPIVGITSQCDVNNRISYYEYDVFNRLSLIRDQDNNILKKICYNYAGQVEDCPTTTNTTPHWVSTGNTRCQPCPANPIYNTGVKEKEEKDNNPSSTTFNNPRWVTDPTGICTSVADWQTTSSTCETTLAGNTGNQILNQIDANPCSPTGGQPRQLIAANAAACPVPLSCNPACANTPDYKCINGVCVLGTWGVVKVVRTSKLVWTCYWAYSFPDGTISNIIQTTTSATACPLIL